MSIKAYINFDEDTEVTASIDSDDTVSVVLVGEIGDVTLRFANGSWENVTNTVDLVLFGENEGGDDEDEE